MQHQYGSQLATGQTVTTTNVVITQPSSTGYPLMVTTLYGHRQWSTGLFNCVDDLPECLLTLCCMPLVECRNASRIGECCCTPVLCTGWHYHSQIEAPNPWRNRGFSV
ncbi:cornifelin-like [Pecten maximus]|uniref:cornifelin-like n=1 Tax=Pecten maximus TaxID=6579 RepID=UPI0014589AAB|nr:cornifelin-like [Pecten maximus]